MNVVRILTLSALLLSCTRLELPNGYRCIAANATDLVIVKPGSQEVVVLGTDMDRIGVFGSFIVAHYNSLAPVPKGFKPFEDEIRRTPSPGYWILDTSSGSVEYLPEGKDWMKRMLAHGVQVNAELGPRPPFLCE